MKRKVIESYNKNNLLEMEKSLRWIRNRMPKSKAAPIKELKERGLAFDAPRNTKGK